MWTGLFGAFPFPDRISGAERIDSAPVRSGVELVEDMIAAAGLDNVDVEHAFYARDTQPTYMMFVAESDEDSVKGLLQTQARGGDRPGGSMYCSRDRAGSLCLWSQDEAVIGLYGWGEPTPVLDVSAAYIRDQLR
jgi:hypothetical protein